MVRHGLGLRAIYASEESRIFNLVQLLFSSAQGFVHIIFRTYYNGNVKVLLIHTIASSYLPMI
jgi:hypothetical protein